MKISLLLSCFFISFAVNAQGFRLKEPDTKAIREELNKGNDAEDEIYIYLLLNYELADYPYDIKYDAEFENRPLCSFRQKFEGDIEYYTYNCGEGPGGSTVITLPLTDISLLKLWIEDIYEANRTEIENVWDKTGLIYRPEDEGAGCYYTIKPQKDKIIVENYCGC